MFNFFTTSVGIIYLLCICWRPKITFFFSIILSLIVLFVFVIKLNYIYLYSLSFLTIRYDFLGLALFLLSLITGIGCVFTVDLKIKKLSFQLLTIFFLFPLILFGFFFTSNILYFFLFYELLLLPSVYLTYISSPNIRSKNVAFYFLLWTQCGSFFVLLAILKIINQHPHLNFNNIPLLVFSSSELFFIKSLLFIGFGIKIPVWPFHFWLTKTHVEANTGFSIFLSGILVKTALFGFYKFNFFFNQFNFFFFFITFIGILDAGLKIFVQVDLKKIVAYCTIFEMNIILTNFFLFSYQTYWFIIYFCILHTILSFFFFYLVDCVYRRFNTRSTLLITNLFNTHPILAIYLIIGVLMFNGLPLTLKFNLEVIFLQKLLNFSLVYFICFFLIQIIVGIFFTKIFFSMLFSTNLVTLPTTDLTLKEITIFNFLIINLLIFSFF